MCSVEQLKGTESWEEVDLRKATSISKLPLGTKLHQHLLFHLPVFL